MWVLLEMTQERLAALSAYKRLTEDQKRAVVLGDLELSDVAADELSERQRHLIMIWLERWGIERGVLE